MSSGKNKQQENYYQTNTKNAVADYTATNPLQAAIDKRAQAQLDWDNSAAPKDVTKAPGFSDALDLYGNAQSLANEQQFRSGAVRLADSNSGYADQLKSLDSFNRFNERAEGLSDALQRSRAEALGLAQNSISASDAKKSNAANLAMTEENNYYQRPQKQSLWSQLAQGALGIGTSYANGGISNLAGGLFKKSNPNLVSTVKPNIGRSVIAQPLQALPSRPY